jgi:hypothetical protein
VADINITQDEADKLMSMENVRSMKRNGSFRRPATGTRAQIKLTKATYQNRVRAAIILMRPDLDGPPHRNPNGVEIPCPHLHIYREGYGDKWAIPAPLDVYANTLDLLSTFEAFMLQCNIIALPNIQKGLFS